MSYRWVDGLQSLDVDFHYTQQQNGVRRRTMAFPITAHCGSSTSWLRIQKRPRFERLLAEDGERLSQDVDNMLRDMVQICTKNCDWKTKPTVLPKRLLDLKGTKNGAEVCLIEVEKSYHVKTEWKYATLSYCWGCADKHLIKTTKANLGKMTAGISVKRLPRSYQDAIIVCRTLDIPFLWIDALCIIQDDEEEWELEAQKLARLYQQALITIIPSADQSAYDGFLERSLPARHPVKVDFHSVLNPGTNETYFINEPDFSGTPLFYQDTAKTKWGNRGWTFNERLFSTRRLYFGAETIHWSCRGFYMSEVDNKCQAPEEYSLKSLTWEPNLKESSLKKHGIEAGENIYFFWCSQFLEYSCRQFTYWNDRLPAISALASFMANITGDKWLAGIWESDLHIELLWSATRFRGPVLLPASSEYIAPSWSWLARAQNAEISHISIQQNLSFITVLDTCIKPDGVNPFGRVRDGYITLEGIVCALSAENLHSVSDERNPIYQEIRWEGRYVGDCAFDINMFDDDEEEGDEGADKSLLNAETFVLLPIRNGLCLKRTISRAALERITENQVQSTLSGLILVPSGRIDNTFCRAGIFESPPIDSGGPVFFERWAKQTITII
ncbi:uncharacterized protein K452DRAFT_271189 [Aplosporella prunicola CBS 121167]|uniref:Heterokaryon incompatibility domain-containing protein n=1 Tax=Aplosporella prunicola CBS 121167 TaxID=1176127 RepID=A0A6A6BDW8_9PEZI|nr:uncharacterized protein K452DRAFT_271189 [Aplosporella prunicola CBS 121167]KAF2141583.1 hypothetical protein K452DRAFT_271189 [Aplosporella prunicola CBS 121167]